MAIVTVSGLPGSSGNKNEVRDSIENLLVDAELGAGSALRQHFALFSKLSVTDDVAQASQVLTLNEVVLGLERKVAFSIALVTTIEGSLEDVAELYATKKTVAGLGNEAVLLNDTDLSTIALRDLDKKTSGVIKVAALDNLSGSLVDMTAVLKSKGIAGLANATLMLEQDAPLTAKNLKALLALADQAGKLENVDVDVSGALTTLDGTLKDVTAVLTAEGLTGLNGIDVTITDTKLTAEALAELTELTDGSITASRLKTLSGDAASVAALVAAGVEGLASSNVTLTDEALDVTELSALLAISTGKISASKLKTLTGSLDEVATIQESGVGLGKAAVQLSDTELTTSALRDLDKRTSGVIDLAELESLGGSLVDMTAVLKSKGIGNLANATLVLEQDAGLTAKDLKALTALATQAGKFENVSVDASGLTGALEGKLSDVTKLLNIEGVVGLEAIDIALTDTKLTAEALAAFSELTTASITAAKLKTLTGDAASVSAILDAGIEGVDSANITLSDLELDAADLNALLAASSGKITASKLKTLSGSLDDILEALATPTSQIANLASKAITLTDSELDASQLLALDAESKGLIDASSLTLLNGSAADIRTALTASAKQVSGLGNQDVSVDDEPSVADLNAIDAATSGVVSASINGTAAQLAGLTAGSNDYAISISDAATLAQLASIAAATSQDFEYSIRDSAQALVGDGSDVSDWLVAGVDVTVTDEASLAQLEAIEAATGDKPNYSALIDTIDELVGDGSDVSEWLVAGVDVTVIDAASLAQLEAIANVIGDGELTYNALIDTIDELVGDGSDVSEWLVAGVDVTVTDAATPAQLAAIAAVIGAGELSYSALSGSADELLANGGFWLVDGVDVTVTGTATPEQLEAIADAIGDGELNQNVVTGSAEELLANGGALLEGAVSVTVTGTPTLAQLEAIEAAFGDKPNYSALADTIDELVGDGSDISEWLLAGVDVTVTDAATPAQLAAIAAAIDGGELSYRALTGSVEELVGDGSTPSSWLADGVSVTVTDAATPAQLAAITDAIGDGELNYSTLTGSVAELIGDGSQPSIWLADGTDVSLTGSATIEQLDAIAAAIGDGELSYSALTGSAGELVGDNSEPSIWLVEGLTVTLTGTASNAQLGVIADAIGTGTLIYGGLNAVITNGMDFSTNYTGTAGVFLTGSDGNQTATGSVYDDVMQGGAGNDTLRGNDGNDQLYGGSGADTLFGGAGDDILYGGEDVTPDGVQDSFVYLPGFSQGNDTIIGFEPGVDRIILLGAAVAELQISTEGEDAIVTLTHANADVTTIRLLDRAGQISPTDIIILGTANADEIQGTAGDDVLSSLAGNDTLYGVDGNDLLFGGDGDDYLHGGAGNDILYGGTGSDILIGGFGDDILVGGDAGPNPQPDGVQNSFVYLPGFGQGNDTIHGFQPDVDRIILSGGGFSDVQISADGGNAVVTLTHSNAEVTTITLVDRAGQINPTDIVTLGTPNPDEIQGSAGDDVISGMDGDDTLLGQVGDDRLFGGFGDDTLNGGAGNDILYGGAGGDTLIGGLGDDIMFGGDSGAPDGEQNLFVYDPAVGHGNDTIYGFQPGQDRILLVGGPVDNIQIDDVGADAFVTLTHSNAEITTITLVNRAGRIDLTDIVIVGTEGNDVLQGDAGDTVISGLGGDDSIDGGAGNDTLYGSLGDDLLSGGGSDGVNGGYDAFLYDYRFGQGSDVISDFNPGQDKIALLGGAAQIDIGADGADALITLTHANDEVTSIRLLGLAGQITQADFSITGNGAHDILYGDGQNNLLAGYGGDDILYGGSGSDILNGGLGDDVLYGGVDSSDDGAQDSFVYDHQVGQGNDTIHGFTAGQDKIVLLGGAAKSIDIAAEGGDAIVTLTHANDETSSIRLIDRADQITASDFSISGTHGDDLLYGTGAADTIVGQAGDDSIVGGAGGDILVGGAGSDRFVYENVSDSVFATGFLDLLIGFEAGVGGDVIDLSALELGNTSYSWSSAIDNLGAAQAATVGFGAGQGIHAVTLGSDTMLFVDADGSGAFAAGDLAIRLIGFTEANLLADNLLT